MLSESRGPRNSASTATATRRSRLCGRGPEARPRIGLRAEVTRPSRFLAADSAQAHGARARMRR
jgi:hypothetical protein